MGETLMDAIGDGAIVEQGGKYFVYALQQRFGSAYIEKGFLLASKGCVRKVFGGRRRAHRDGDVATAAHLLGGLEDQPFELRRARCGENPSRESGADRRPHFHVLDVQRI